jgi:hypothetical protein
VKYSKAQIFASVHAIPELQFSDVALTSFSGLVVLQALFHKLRLKGRLAKCFGARRGATMYGLHTVMLLLIVHIMIGFRRLHDVAYYADDPMVARVLGLRRLPSVATLSRTLRIVNAGDAGAVRAFSRELVCERLGQLTPRRLTLDFDGSVCDTRAHAEGTAVGMNKKRKGARSYYPLLCTVAQTSQVFDILHRPGNVHDSNGAEDFAVACFETARAAAPGVILESRMDSAFFSHNMAVLLDDQDARFTISVPFERFTELKGIIEAQKRWTRLDDTWDYFELDWKPKNWTWQFRFIALRRKSNTQQKGPLQLNLFEPASYIYEYKVIVTNMDMGARKVLRFHNGRGAQEALFAEAKTHAAFGYIPVRTQAGNQFFMTACVIAHNLGRELQMSTGKPTRNTTEKRAPRWAFEHLGTLRRRLIARAGRITRPGGRLTLTLSPNAAVRRDLLRFIDSLIGNHEKRSARAA